MDNSGKDKILHSDDGEGFTFTANSLDRVKHNYHQMASMQGLDGKSVGGLMINESGLKNLPENQDKKSRKDKDTFYFITMLDQMNRDIAAIQSEIADYRNQLSNTLGSDFINELGAKYLSEETARYLPGETLEEYEHRIALEIEQRLAAGEIDIDDPVLSGWLDAHSRLEDQLQQRAILLSDRLEEGFEDGILTTEEKRAAGLLEADAGVAFEGFLQSEKAPLRDVFAAHSSAKSRQDIAVDTQFADMLSELKDSAENTDRRDADLPHSKEISALTPKPFS